VFELKPFQIPQHDIAVEALRKGKVFIDAGCTGSGKTYTALAIARTLKMPILIIAPKSSRSQWLTVASTIPEVTILGITNPENLVTSNKNPWFNRISRTWSLPPDTLVVWDEVHRGASGEKSLTTEACARLKAYPVKLLAMSATLAETPLKMRATGFHLGLHGFNMPSFRQFCLDNGCSWQDVPSLNNSLIRKHGGRTQQRLVFTGNKKKAVEFMARIRVRTKGQMQGLRVSDIPGFPEQIVEVILFDTNAREEKEITQAYADMSDKMKSPTGSTLSDINRCRERIEFVKARMLVEEALKLVEDGFSVPIFINFTAPRKRMAAMLLKTHPSLPQIYGGQSEEERTESIRAFQANEQPIMLVMTQAGGVALSLHDIHNERPRVSLINPSYRADELIQTLGRIRRIGGTTAIQRIILTAGTVEEKVASKLERKVANLEAFNDDDLNPFTTRKETIS